MFTVLAFAAPVVVVGSFSSFVIIFAGAGAPLAFAITVVFLVLFSAGYTAMGRYLPNPGAFYAYISAGLGKHLGLGSSFTAIFGYFMMNMAMASFFGYILNDFIVNMLGGPSVPWYLYSLACLVTTGILGYLRIDLSAKVLCVAMALEIGIIAVFDFAVLRDGGPEGRSLEPFTLGALTSGEVGLAVLYCAICFLGFEATAVYREETKDPARTVPRATYLAVLFIGFVYVVSTFLLITAYGSSAAQDVANEDPAGMFPNAMESYVGTWARDSVTVLIITSTFACLLAVQNILSRYLFSLAVDGALPKRLGRVHPKHRSPAASSLTVTAVAMTTIILLSQSDPIVNYGLLSGTGGFAILLLMFLTGLAVFNFFRDKRGAPGTTLWNATIAPILGSICFGVVLYLAITNFTMMTGGSTAVAVGLQTALWSSLVIGIVVAAVLRRKRPETFERIGRQG
ncbi:hypothetical protein AWB99_14270 [Mycolicibacterium confluentis]|nr:hypothetical protein AWB99_14270 [Mycolicibacterium confluentis]